MQWATVALICADLLLLLSTDFMRQKFYNAIFIPSHIVCAVLLAIISGSFPCISPRWSLGLWFKPVLGDNRVGLLW